MRLLGDAHEHRQFTPSGSTIYVLVIATPLCGFISYPSFRTANYLYGIVFLAGAIGLPIWFISQDIESVQQNEPIPANIDQNEVSKRLLLKGYQHQEDIWKTEIGRINDRLQVTNDSINVINGSLPSFRAVMIQ